MIKNKCARYEHADGYPMPESAYSCRGCVNSYDPNGYDPGCPCGFAPRDKELTDGQQRKEGNNADL